MVAPLLVAAGLFIAGQIGEALIEGFIRQTTEASTIVGKTELAIQKGFMRDVTADALDSMCEVEPHYNVGVSTDGLMEIVERFMRAVAKASLALTPEIAEELYTELLQEGFSNAVQMSVGGALQSILNTWRGGYPPNPEDLEELARTLDKLDIDLFALLIAQSGCNIPTSAWKVAKGFDSYVEQKHTDLKAQADTALNRLNSLLSLPYELGDNVLSNEIMEIIGLFREAYIRAQNLIEYVAERALSRLNELRAEVKTVEEWLDWSNEHPEQILITPDEAYYVALENKLEADATMNSYNDTKTKIENSLTDLDVDVSGFMTEVDNLLGDVASHYNNIISKSVIDMTEEINMIKEAFKKLVAYRNAKDSQSSLKSSVVLQ